MSTITAQAFGAASTVNIGGDGSLFIGQDATLDLALVDTNQHPVDLTGMTVVFDVRKTDSAKSAIFSKIATLVGVYDPDPTINTQRARVSLSDDELNTVRPRTYRYSFKRIDVGKVFARGDFTVEKATAP